MWWVSILAVQTPWVVTPMSSQKRVGELVLFQCSQIFTQLWLRSFPTEITILWVPMRQQQDQEQREQACEHVRMDQPSSKGWGWPWIAWAAALSTGSTVPSTALWKVDVDVQHCQCNAGHKLRWKSWGNNHCHLFLTRMFASAAAEGSKDFYISFIRHLKSEFQRHRPWVLSTTLIYAVGTTTGHEETRQTIFLWLWPSSDTAVLCSKGGWANRPTHLHLEAAEKSSVIFTGCPSGSGSETRRG